MKLGTVGSSGGVLSCGGSLCCGSSAGGGEEDSAFGGFAGFCVCAEVDFDGAELSCTGAVGFSGFDVSGKTGSSVFSFCCSVGAGSGSFVSADDETVPAGLLSMTLLADAVSAVLLTAEGYSVSVLSGS